MLLLSAPNLAGNEWKYVKDCLDTGWISSAGAYVTEFENKVAEFAGSKYGVAAVNGTAALHIALQVSGVQRADLVIVPNITFVASANAIKYTGADPIFMDVHQDTWQIDVDLLASFLAKQTVIKNQRCYHRASQRPITAIMPVHVLGNMANMDQLITIAAQYHLALIEDATESLGSYYQGRHSGSFGKMGCFSFNGNKIISTGGGGVLVTDDETLAKKAKHLTTQAKADALEYFHDDIGYNYRLVNVLAAIGVAQLEQLPVFIQRKKDINHFYRNTLAGVGDITFQEITAGVDPNCWLFTFSTAHQKQLLKTLNEQQIQSRPFWVPMNQLPMFKDDIYVSDSDHSALVYQNCLSIPSSTFLKDHDLETVVAAIKKFYT